MKHLSLVILLLALIMPSPANAQAENSVTKTYCTSSAGYADVDAMKADLLVNAKRLVVNELFSELISASTLVEDMVVTSDQIRASSEGFVRVKGDAEFFNGEGFAEICVTVVGYATAEDYLLFEPEEIGKRLCMAQPDLSADALAEFVKSEAIIQALFDYDRRLETVDRVLLLRLLRTVRYIESGFLADTTTYCVTLEGLVTPVEVLALGMLDGSTAGTNGTSAPGSKPESDQSGADEGVVTLEDRHVADCTTELQFGQIVTCSLETEGEEHRYTFNAEPEDKFFVTMTRTDGDLSPGFAVLDKNGDRVSMSNTYCHASDSTVAESPICIAERSGQYTIVVSSSEADTTGSYRLMVQRLTAPGLATPVEFGASVIGEISELAQYDFYTFNAERDDRFIVSVIRSGGDLAPGFRVTDRNGDQVTMSNTYCHASDSKAAESPICMAERSGQFTIIVGSSEYDTTGSYRLTLRKQN